MIHLRSAAGLCAAAASLILLGGCAGDIELARQVSRTEALDECRKLTDSGAYLDCKKRAQQMHARR